MGNNEITNYWWFNKQEEDVEEEDSFDYDEDEVVKSDYPAELVEAKKALTEKLKEDYGDDESPEDPQFNERYCQWDVKEEGVYVPSHQPNFVNHIPSGYYKIGYSDQIGFFLKDKKIKTDQLFNLPINDGDKVVEDIHNFWAMKERYKKYQYLHKRGILLYGPPGSGKTCVLNLLIEDLIKEQGGVIFSIEHEGDLNLYSDFSQIFREIEPNRPIIVVIEDIDGLLDGRGSCEKKLLNVLDGINQIESVAYVATTNYPESLEQRLLNRPGRFDRRFYIGFPDAKVRLEYFKNKILPEDLEENSLKEMVEKTQGFTISHCKEIFASVVIRGRNLDEVVEEMQKMNKEVINSSEDDPTRKKPGFFGRDKEDKEKSDGIEEIDWEEEVKEIEKKKDE